MRPNEIYRFTTFGSINGLLATIAQPFSTYRNSFKIASIHRQFHPFQTAEWLLSVALTAGKAGNLFLELLLRHPFQPPASADILKEKANSNRHFSKAFLSPPALPLHIDSKSFATSIKSQSFPLFVTAMTAVTGISLYRDIPVICVTAVMPYELNQPALSRPLGAVLDSGGLQHLIVKLP